MLGIIPLVISMFVGYILPNYIGLGLIGVSLVLTIIFLLNSNGSGLDGIGNIILAAIFGCVFVGLGIGKSLDYFEVFKIQEKIELNNKLPELICKSDNNTFILVNYKTDKDNIINLKTDQVFNKSNCSLN